MKKIGLLAAAALMVSLPVMAQMAEGEVTRINEPESKITLRHGPIKSLDMDSMTMVFRVKEPAMLKQVKEGDKVRFEAARVDGQLTITRLQKR